jgi:hypothetical protein
VLPKEDLGAADALHFEADDQLVVQSCRLEILDRQLADDEGDAGITQQIGLAVADRAQPFGAAALQVFQIIGVVDYPAGVGIFVVDAHPTGECCWFLLVVHGRHGF